VLLWFFSIEETDEIELILRCRRDLARLKSDALLSRRRFWSSIWCSLILWVWALVCILIRDLQDTKL
jgi:hypothetical protein